MATYKPLQSVVLTSATTEVTFSNIDQSYTDLILVTSAQNVSNSGADCYIRFNGDSGTNYSRLYVVGDGSAVTSGNNVTQSGINIFSLPSSGATFNPFSININGYSNSVTWKTATIRATGNTNYLGGIVGTWRSTSPVTSITVGYVNSINSGSTFSLYGIKAGSPKAVGGDVVTTDGTYWYHAFKNSGTFTVQQGSALTADLLVVAGGGGGGGGGYSGAGGGGAGGLVYLTNQTLSAGNDFSVLVGAGGNRGTGITAQARAGTNSQIGTFTAAVGGGYGGTYLINNGSGGNGGSGGGQSYGSGSIGTGTAGQGNNGGARNGDGGGGGGGAGAVGQTAPTIANGGAGGAGVNTYSSLATATGTGASGYYAGGGGGAGYGSSSGTNGAGGAGGGGAAATGSGNSGTANTGGGGGGAGATGGAQPGGNGGSGIVIVRYAV